MFGRAISSVETILCLMQGVKDRHCRHHGEGSKVPLKGYLQSGFEGRKGGRVKGWRVERGLHHTFLVTKGARRGGFARPSWGRRVPEGRLRETFVGFEAHRSPPSKPHSPSKPHPLQSFTPFEASHPKPHTRNLTPFEASPPSNPCPFCCRLRLKTPFVGTLWNLPFTPLSPSEAPPPLSEAPPPFRKPPLPCRKPHPPPPFRKPPLSPFRSPLPPPFRKLPPPLPFPKGGLQRASKGRFEGSVKGGLRKGFEPPFLKGPRPHSGIIPWAVVTSLGTETFMAIVA